MLGLLALCAAGVCAFTAPVASATHVPGHPQPPVGVSAAGTEVAYVARPGEENNVTVDVTPDGASYVIRDTGVTTFETDGNCTVAGNVATCPRAGVVQVVIEVGDMDDTVRGSPDDDVILGGPGGDLLIGAEGDDFFDTGLGQDPGSEAFDRVEGGPGFNTASFASRDPAETVRQDPLGNPIGIMIDNRPDRQFTIDIDGSFKTLIKTQRLVGTDLDDEIIGSYESDELVGGGGADVLCGSLGVDTVNYSYDSESRERIYGAGVGVHVTLDGDMPTDPDVALQLQADPDELSFGLRERYLRARHDCRQYTPANGFPEPDCIRVPGNCRFGPPPVIDRECEPGDPDCTPDARDCTPDDGAWDPVTRKTLEGDCVGEDVENIIGSPNDDVLIGNDPDPLEGRSPRVEPLGVNRIEGRGGNDIMDGRGGPDIYEGGDGHDTVTYGGLDDIAIELPGRQFEGRTTPVNATIDGVANDGGAEDRNRANLTDSIGTDVEEVIGGSGDDTLTGGAGPEVLRGGPGNDYIDGGGGDDLLDGGEGNDTIAGGEGNDTILGGPGDDVLDGEAGANNIRGEAGNDRLIGGSGPDTLSGGEGLDTLDYSGYTVPVHVSLDGVNNDGALGEGDNALPDFEIVLGGIADDTLIGSDAAEQLEGGDGDDTLIGGGGPDILSGGPGTDLVSYADRTAPVHVNLAAPGNDGEAGENDHIRGVERVRGGSGDDVLLGDGKDNVLLGGPGNDRLAGAEGDDLLVGGSGDDQLSGDVGNDTLFGSDGNDTLFGGEGDDALFGEAGNDTLDGGPGNDRIHGGPHIDTVLYSSRTGDVTVSLSGQDGNGEAGENDFINHDVENVTTGSGDDTIDADDNLPGKVKCGAGTDLVIVDPDDEVDGDCENVRVAARGTRCTAQTRGAVRMRRSGAIRVRVFCAATARGTLRLQSSGRVRTRKGGPRRVLRLGSRRFSLKAGQRRTITVRAPKAVRRVIRRKKRLSVRARIAAKAKTQRRTLRTSKVFTVRAPRR